MAKTGRPLTRQGQVEQILGDVGDGCAEIAAVVAMIEKARHRLVRAHTHGGRAYRIGVALAEDLGPAPWDGVDRRGGWDGVERRRHGRALVEIMEAAAAAEIAAAA